MTKQEKAFYELVDLFLESDDLGEWGDITILYFVLYDIPISRQETVEEIVKNKGITYQMTVIPTDPPFVNIRFEFI